MPVRGRILTNGEDPSEAIALWKEIFGREEFDYSTDFRSIAVAYESEGEANEKAVAAGRLFYDGDCCRLDAVAVRNGYRGRGYGDLIVRMLLSKAFASGIQNVICAVSEDTELFFQGIGFRASEEEAAHYAPEEGAAYGVPEREIAQDMLKCKIMTINTVDFIPPCRK